MVKTFGKQSLEIAVMNRTGGGFLLFLLMCSAVAPCDDWDNLEKEVKQSVSQADYIIVADAPDSFWASGMIFGRFEILKIIWEAGDSGVLRENEHVRVAVKIEKGPAKQDVEKFRGSEKVILFLKSTPHGYFENIRSEVPILLGADNEKLIDLVNEAVQSKRRKATER